jgi:formamidopyrimidine-DNA glycosylase
MPEIPDLENFARKLNESFKGKKLLKLKVLDNRRFEDSEEDLKKNLEGKKLLNVYRSGKELRFQFSDDVLVGLHLMLHGDFYLFEKKNTNKFTRAELLFEDDKGLALTDWQRNANLRLSPIEKSGIDAMDPKLNFKALKEILQSSGMVKKVLTNQENIRGLGNAYTDEILWEARISPYSTANAIPDEKIKDLAKAIKTVLKRATKHIAKHHDSITGELRDFLIVHNSKKTHNENGYEIKKEKKGGSNTYYTDEQELYH